MNVYDKLNPDKIMTPFIPVIISTLGGQARLCDGMRSKLERSALRATVLLLCLYFFNFVPAQASASILTANFDDLTEGTEGSSLSDGGINFLNLDNRIPGITREIFDIDATTDNLPEFSPPNYLTFGGFSPGSGSSFGRFGSADIDFSGVGSFASLDVFSPETSSKNTLTLEGLLGGIVVASDTITFYNPNQEVVGQQLNISGTFDSLQLVAAGSDNNGADFFGVDSVSITTVPESSNSGFTSYLLAGVFLYCFGFSTRRNQKISQ